MENELLVVPLPVSVRVSARRKRPRSTPRTPSAAKRRPAVAGITPFPALHFIRVIAVIDELGNGLLRRLHRLQRDLLLEERGKCVRRSDVVALLRICNQRASHHAPPPTPTSNARLCTGTRGSPRSTAPASRASTPRSTDGDWTENRPISAAGLTSAWTGRRRG